MKKHVFLIFLGAIFSNSFAEEKMIWTFNATTNIMTAYDRTSQVAVLDPDHNKSCLYNGISGAAFIFDYEDRTGVYIREGLSKKTWYSSQQKFEDYFLSLPSQDTMYKLGEKEGLVFNESSITAQISEIMTQMLIGLSMQYSNPCDSFTTFLRHSKVNGNSLKSSLEGFSEVMGNVNSEIRGDFMWLVQTFGGFGTFFGEFKCGLSLLSDVDVKLDFNKILNEPTGLDIMNYVLKQAAPKLDIGHILGHALNCEQHFFQLVNGLSANLTYGIDGFINIISKIEDFIHGDCSMQDVVNIIYAYYKSPKTNRNYVRKQWSRAIKNLLDTIEEFHSTESLKELTKLLRDILGNRWKIVDNNMTIMVETLLKIDPKDDMTAVIYVLELLENVKPIKSHS